MIRFKNRKAIFGSKKSIFDENPRYYIILGMFFVIFIIIVKTLFTYTIIDYKFYKQKADEQQILGVKILITRGSIFSGNKKIKLATTVNLDDLAIDPTQIGDKKKLILFLTDVIYKELCIGKKQEKCRNNILKFIKKEEFEENFILNKKNIKKLIEDKLIEKIRQKYITSVIITRNLDEKQINDIKKLNLKGIYIFNKALYVDPTQIENKDLVAKKIAGIISFPEENIKKYLKLRERKYILLLKKLSIENSSEIQEVLKNEKNAYLKGYIKKENTIFSFIKLDPNPHRYYPENKTAAQVLGFVDKQGKGHYGIEGYYNEILRGEADEIVIKKDIKGRIINPIDLKKGVIHRQGATIYTTIDRNIQKKAEEILKAGVKKYRANKGSVVILNPKNGKIIAMANYPSFDPNNPGEVYELEKVNYKKYKNQANDLIGRSVFVEDKIKGKEFYINGKKILLRRATREELGNYALKKYIYKNSFGVGVYRNGVISDLYEPGSIMKPITMAIGIDSGEITKDTFYQNNGPIKIDRFKISDIAHQCRGYHSFTWALKYSCNVGMVRIVQKIGKALLYNYLEKFGFGKPTEVSLEGEVSRVLTNYHKWSKAQLYTSSYGLGINVNELQMAVAYSALANGGFILKPQIVDKIVFGKGKELKFKKEIIRRVISEKTSKDMIEVLHTSIESGVAKTGKVEGYALAGKTGTSQIAYRGAYESGNIPGTTNGSFAGFGPVQDPKFVIIVKLVRPRTNNYGGLTSAYIFADIAKFLLEYYKIPKIKK